MSPEENKFSNFSHSRIVAVSALIVLVIAALITGHLMIDLELFSLRPPAINAFPFPATDVKPEDAYQLYQTVFTAWVALILLIPASINFWVRGHSDAAAESWKNFWSVSFAAFLIHLYWAIFVFFEANYFIITSSSRVSAFWPGILVAVWWGSDVILVWTTNEDRRWVRYQRVFIHLVVAAFFIVASVIEGEILMSKALGLALIFAVLGGILKRYVLR